MRRTETVGAVHRFIQLFVTNERHLPYKYRHAEVFATGSYQIPQTTKERETKDTDKLPRTE